MDSRSRNITHFEHIEKICSALDVTVEEFFNYSLTPKVGEVEVLKKLIMFQREWLLF